MQQKKSQDAIMDEGRAIAESIAEVRAAGNLGDRPLIVLTAGKPYLPDPLLTEEKMDRQNNLWINDLQPQEARLSTRSKQIIAPNSSHEMLFDGPDAIVSAIREIYEQTNSQFPVVAQC